MARHNIEGVEIYDSIFKGGNRMGTVTQTLTADIVLADNAPPLLILDANGAARNVRLPPNPQKGDYFIILNPAAGAFALTLLTSAGGALSPAVTVPQAKGVMVFWTGTVWKAMAGA